MISKLTISTLIKPIKKIRLVKPYLTFVILVMAYIFLSKPVLAVSVIVSNAPPLISEEPFAVDVQVSGAQANTTNYLRIDLYEPETTNYFGYTYNGTIWYFGSDYTQFFLIPIDSAGSWSGLIQGKLDPSSSKYKGSGNYNLKVRRYTAGGSYTWSNELSVAVTGPTPSPTITPTLTSTPTSRPTATPKPTSQSTSTKSNPSSTPSKAVSNQAVTAISTSKSKTGEVLGGSENKEDVQTSPASEATLSLAVEPTATSTSLVVAGWQQNLPKIALFFGGLLLLGSGGLILFKKNKDKFRVEDNL